jgi:hypothetical protein
MGAKALDWKRESARDAAARWVLAVASIAIPEMAPSVQHAWRYLPGGVQRVAIQGPLKFATIAVAGRETDT